MSPGTPQGSGRLARTPFVAGNWKCHLTVPEAMSLMSEVKIGLASVSGVDVVVAPPFTAIPAMARWLDGTNIGLAAQNCYHVDYGAYTGEVSVAMLKDAKCRYVIVGHSERRQLFGETDQMVSAKLRTVLRFGLQPIVCIGETLEERESGRTEDRLRQQLEFAMAGLQPVHLRSVILAYEPVWAIGTGRNATPQQAQAVHSFLRKALRGRFAEAALGIRIIYGGSVKSANISQLMEGEDVDGALVGGASLKADEFVAIVQNATGAKR